MTRILMALAGGHRVEVADAHGNRGRVLGISCDRVLVAWDDVRMGARFVHADTVRVVDHADAH